MTDNPQTTAPERQLGVAVTGDPDLGPLKLLPGTWANIRPDAKPASSSPLFGRGWNMIALPFVSPPGVFPPPFRLLLNQYNETLKFFLVDKRVPNRGIGPTDAGFGNTDQFVVTIDYEQEVRQLFAEDFPASDLRGTEDPDQTGRDGAAIHHEPGLFLHMLNETAGGPTIARLATIPHGDAALALGTATEVDGPPEIPTLNALPIGVSQDLVDPGNRYLDPYRHFRDDRFRGIFDPTNPSELLAAANQGVDIVRTTVLELDTTVTDGGIHNIPFVVRQANASEMKSTFWIQELAETDDHGKPKLRLQYLQIVQLDFLRRTDGGPGRIKWPHVSINTMEKISEETKTPSLVSYFT